MGRNVYKKREMRTFFLIVIIHCSLASIAQDLNRQNNNQIMLIGALDSNSAWELGLSYTRRLSPWCGVGVGMNVYKQYSDEIHASGSDIQGAGISEWILSDNSTRVGGLQLNPFVHINTPSLCYIEDAGLKLYIEPGALLTVSSNKCEVDYWDGHGYYATQIFKGHGGDWLSWACRIGLSLENDFGFVNIGYFTSNLDMYAYKRNIRIGNTTLGDGLPKRHSNWGIFIGVGLKFH